MKIKSMVLNAIFFAAICWGSSIIASDSKKLNILMKRAAYVLATAGAPRSELAKNNAAHHPDKIVIKQQTLFNKRLLQLCCNKGWYRVLFISIR